MKKYILSLSQNSDKVKELYLLESNKPYNKSEFFQRTSPIFLINKLEIETSTFKNGFILLVYTLDSFFLTGRILHFIKQKNYDDPVYVFHTLGLASIVIYCKENKDIIDNIIKLLNDNIINYETWELKDNKINLIDTIHKDFSGLPRSEINLEDLHFEDKIVLNEILPSFDFFQSFISSFLPVYKEFSEEVRKTILDLYYRLLLINQKISEETFSSKIEDLFNNKEISKKALKSFKKHSTPKLKIINHFQIRDELIQISAILRTINSQAFFGLNCFNPGFSRTGNNSIFGTGLAYGSILCLYENMRYLFSQNINLSRIKDEYSKFSSPPLKANPADYELWKRKLGGYNNLKNLNKEADKSNTFFHLIYFSNRLGFRETKRSISVAQQSMYLGSLPPWSLNTFTHEFIHAHVRGLLSIIYPISVSDNSSIDEEIYYIYKNRSNKIDSCKDLLSFIKVNILEVIHNLHAYNKSSSTKVNVPHYLDIDALSSALKRYHHEIDEIMVHVLDFHYFYSASPSLYIKSIWSSWLTLPLTVSRIPEYLTRTITAISTKEVASRDEKLAIAIETTLKELTNLKNYSFIDKDQLNFVIGVINNDEFKSQFKKQFFEIWCPLSDLTLQFLYSNDLKDSLNSEFDEKIQTNEPEYHLMQSEFIESRIDSPIKFLNYLLHIAFNSKTKEYKNSDEIECNTVWMLSVINSNLFNK
jgi:hypothetical protein